MQIQSLQSLQLTSIPSSPSPLPQLQFGPGSPLVWITSKSVLNNLPPHSPFRPLPNTLSLPFAIHYLPECPLPSGTSTTSLYSNHTKLLAVPQTLIFYASTPLLTQFLLSGTLFFCTYSVQPSPGQVNFLLNFQDSAISLFSLHLPFRKT